MTPSAALLFIALARPAIGSDPLSADSIASSVAGALNGAAKAAGSAVSGAGTAAARELRLWNRVAQAEPPSPFGSHGGVINGGGW